LQAARAADSEIISAAIGSDQQFPVYVGLAENAGHRRRNSVIGAVGGHEN